MAETLGPTRVWVRREDGGVTFGLRFEAPGGKGVLRVERAGVRLDPPARMAGSEGGLSAEQLRGARFAAARDGRRLAFDLERLDDAALARLSPGAWRVLVAEEHGERAQLVLPPDELLEPTAVRLSAPALAPAPTGPPTLAAPPGPGLVRHLRRALERERAENARLQAEVARLEDRLRAAERRGG